MMRKESFAHKRGNQLRHFRDIPRRGIVELSFAEAAVSAGAFFFTRQGRPKGPRQPVPPGRRKTGASSSSRPRRSNAADRSQHPVRRDSLGGDSRIAGAKGSARVSNSFTARGGSIFPFQPFARRWLCVSIRVAAKGFVFKAAAVAFRGRMASGGVVAPSPPRGDILR